MAAVEDFEQSSYNDCKHLYPFRLDQCLLFILLERIIRRRRSSDRARLLLNSLLLHLPNLLVQKGQESFEYLRNSPKYIIRGYVMGTVQNKAKTGK